MSYIGPNLRRGLDNYRQRSRLTPLITHAVEAGPELSAFTYEPSVTYGSTIRVATIEDVANLAGIELSAYRNVYGDVRCAETVSAVEAKYLERVETLGEHVRVIETPDDGVYGMIVSCPTSCTREDFLESGRDMTDNDAIKEIYDPNGSIAYVVNVAVMPNRYSIRAGTRLFTNALQFGAERGIKKAYFESRLPGFERWLKRRDLVRCELDGSELHSLAEDYWKSTILIGGEKRPADPLLRVYVGMGALPLKLVKDAWKIDGPSCGYGVLCELENTLSTRESTAASRLVQVTGKEKSRTYVCGDQSEEVQDDFGRSQGQAIDLLGRWIGIHRRSIVLCTALGSVALTTLTGRVSEIIDNASVELPWVVPVYATSLSIYFGSAALMLAAAGRTTRDVFRFDRQLSQIAEQVRESHAMQVGFWANTCSALTAAGVAVAGIVETLPPTAWGTLVIPAADVYSTVILRGWLYGKIRSKVSA